MKSFEWANAGSVDEAVKLLAADAATDPDEIPRPMGGGQDLLSTMKSYIVRPPRVVNLKTINGIGKIAADGGGGFAIDALVTITQVGSHEEIGKAFPGLTEAAHSIATPQIRNLGTVGGNLNQRPRCWYFRNENLQCIRKGGNTCYAVDGENKYHAIFGDGPCVVVQPSDLAPMLIALNAVVSIAGPKGKRDLPLENYFVLPTEKEARKENVLMPGEIVTQITVPASTAKSTYIKMKERASLDFAMVSVAAAVDFNADNSVKQARLVLGGVAPAPWSLLKVNDFLAGKKLDDDTIKKAGELAVDGANPLDHNGYKVPLTSALVRRALAKLIA
jgi:xanthine dehydrogenase YagS FAD-binding subunit